MISAKQIPASNEAILYKHTGAVHIANRLSFVERKIYNILMERAYKGLLTEGMHQISIGNLIERLGHIEQSYKNHDFIKTCLFNLVNNSIAFNILGKDKKNKKTWDSIASLLSEVHFKDGMITYSFPQALSMLLAKPSIYSPLNLNYQTKFSSKYALALWEFCSEQLSSKRRENVTTDVILLEVLNELLGGVEKIYSTFKEFNRQVLKMSVAEINAGTDLIVDYKLVRKSRKVEGITLYIQRKIIRTEEQIPLFHQENNTDIIKYIRDTIEGQDMVCKAHELGIDEQQVSAMSKKFDVSTINDALDLLHDRIKSGHKIDNLAGYLWTILENGVFKIAASDEVSQQLAQKDLFKKLAAKSTNTYAEHFMQRCIETFGILTVQNWIGHLEYVTHGDTVVEFTVPTAFIKEWIETNYLKELLKLWQEQYPETTELSIAIKKAQ